MLRKEGAIHCVSWSPAGDEFICIFGESPPEACIFNLKCEVTFSFGEAPRNTVSWSPHGRFLALAGFGNMAGELSFWDRRATPQVRDRGSHSISASLTYDGGHLPAAQVPLDGRGAHDRRIWLVARLTPLPHCHPLPAPTRRQRLSSASPPAQPQRNQPRQTGLSPHPVTTPRHPTPSPHPVTTRRPHLASPPLQVWSCAGGLLHEERMEELSLATWRPAPAERFAPPTDADVRAYPAKAAPKPTAQAKKCASSSRLTRDLGGVDSWRRPLFA